jgi:hypothetical protein
MLSGLCGRCRCKRLETGVRLVRSPIDARGSCQSGECPVIYLFPLYQKLADIYDGRLSGKSVVRVHTEIR